MRDERVSRHLTELGLAGATLGRVEAIEVSAPPRGEGRTAIPPPDRMDRVRRAKFGPVASQTFEAVGLVLAVLPGVPTLCRVTAPPGRVIAEVAGASWAHLDTAEPRTAFFEVGRDDVCVILTDTSGLAIDGGTWETAALEWPDGQGLRCSVAPPVRDWCIRAGDGWMSAFVDSRLSSEDAWHATVAAGTFARLIDYASERRRAIVASHLAGRVDNDFIAPQWWAEALSPAQVRLVRGMTLAQLDSLKQDLEALIQEDDEGEARWAERVRGVCHRRDDIESVRWALQVRGEALPLAPALRGVDALGEALLAGLSVVPAHLDDERLQRVLVGQPTAWWARPVDQAYGS